MPTVFELEIMIDTRYCTAGRNRAGEWFIACKDDGWSSLKMLDDLNYTEVRSNPPDRHFDHAARHVRAQGGMFWKTNAVGEYRTVAGIPDAARDDAGD
ncbi:MAG: hypothetical protein WCD16_14655 [Paracoccaceae bacterium]